MVEGGLLLSCIALFMVMSILCGFAQSITQLILSRLFQGIAAGGVMTLCQASISDVVSPKERIRYQGLFTGTFAMSAVAGPDPRGIANNGLVLAMDFLHQCSDRFDCDLYSLELVTYLKNT